MKFSLTQPLIPLILLILAPLFSQADSRRPHTVDEWSQALAIPEFKGSNPCAESKGIRIANDRLHALCHPKAEALIQFGFDSTTIESQYNAALNNLGRALETDLSAAHLRIHGHTDAIGSAVYNQGLSERRAESVRRYLIQHFSIAAYRLQTIGHGESLPKVNNRSEANRRFNRRVEFERM